VIRQKWERLQKEMKQHDLINLWIKVYIKNEMDLRPTSSSTLGLSHFTSYKNYNISIALCIIQKSIADITLLLKTNVLLNLISKHLV
jgi:hypothetical protein